MSSPDIAAIMHKAQALLEQGQASEAQPLYEKIVTLDPQHSAAWEKLCQLTASQGQYQQAENCCRRAAALRPESVEVLNHLASALMQQNRHAEAAAVYQKLTELQPESTVFSYALATSYTSLGQLDAAASAYRKTLALNPGHIDSHYGLGFIAYTQHHYPDAVRHFRQVLQLNPSNAQALNGLASCLQALGEYREALSHYDAAIKLVPVFVDAHFGRGCTLIVLGDTEGAISSLQQALKLNPNHAGACISLASAIMTFGRHDEALRYCERALQIVPQNADATALAATIEQHAGKAEQAMQRLQPWVKRGIENVNLAIAFAEVSKTLDRPDEAIAVMARLLSQPQPLPVTSQRNLHFNLGRLYDKTGQYDKAFEHYRLGNQTRALEYRPEANTREIEAIIAIHSKAFMANAPRAAVTSEKPVFIVGMPRSGTSLVEQILSSHPQVHGAGELPDLWQMVAMLPRMLATGRGYPYCMTALQQPQVNTLARHYLDRLDKLAPDARRVVDKMPGNFRFLGLIALLFPGAKVIHCTRDPVDICLSCYFQDFSRSHAYSYDLAQLGAYYNDYRRLMEHWQTVLQLPVLDVSYEKLVDDQEAVSRELVAYCGLDWDEQCLNFHQAGRFVATASYDQVRRPLYKRSVRRWKHYEKHLGPLITALQQPPTAVAGTDDHNQDTSAR